MNSTHEIPLKQWLHEEGARLGITPNAVSERLASGRYYRHVKLRRENGRVIWVNKDSLTPPPSTELQFKKWREQEAARLGISVSAVNQRFYVARKYPNLKLRRENKRRVFVIQEQP